MQAPVVKHFIRNKPGEFPSAHLERVLDLQTIAVSPRVDLRRAPATFEKIAIADSKLAGRKPDLRPER